MSSYYDQPCVASACVVRAHVHASVRVVLHGLIPAGSGRAELVDLCRCASPLLPAIEPLLRTFVCTHEELVSATAGCLGTCVCVCVCMCAHVSLYMKFVCMCVCVCVGVVCFFVCVISEDVRIFQQSFFRLLRLCTFQKIFF